MPPRSRTQPSARRPRVAGLRDPRRHQDGPTSSASEPPTSPDTTAPTAPTDSDPDTSSTSLLSFVKSAPGRDGGDDDAPTVASAGTVTPAAPAEDDTTADADESGARRSSAATSTATRTGARTRATTATTTTRPTRAAKPKPTGRASTTRRRPPPATGSARTESRGASRGRRTTRGGAPRAAPRWLVPALGVAVVVLLVLAGLGLWSGHDAWTTGPRANSAVVDAAGTAEVVGATRQAMEQVFSYDPTKMDDSVNAARDLGTGDFPRQYTEVFDRSTKPNATAQGLRQTASVLDIGVSSIDGDQAKLIVLVQFDVTRASTGQSATTPGLLEANMQRADGRWKVARVTPLTGQS